MAECRSTTEKTRCTAPDAFVRSGKVSLACEMPMAANRIAKKTFSISLKLSSPASSNASLINQITSMAYDSHMLADLEPVMSLAYMVCRLSTSSRDNELTANHQSFAHIPDHGIAVIAVEKSSHYLSYLQLAFKLMNEAGSEKSSPSTISFPPYQKPRAYTLIMMNCKQKQPQQSETASLELVLTNKPLIAR